VPYVKIYFRYLFVRLFMPFAVCLAACTLIWVMIDIYGNLEDFLEHKGSFLSTLGIIIRFYSLQIPSMLVLVLPATMLISTMWTLLALNRRSELVAFQAGGMAPVWLFSPFIVFGLIWTVILLFDLNWPAPLSLVTRERLLDQAKGQNAKSNVFTNLPYNDRLNRRIWFFQSLDTNQGTAKGMSVLERNSNGDDLKQYFADQGEYTPGGFWRLTGVLLIQYGPEGNVEKSTNYQQLDAEDLTTPPRQISLVISQPEQLTVAQLSQYINTSTSTPENLAKFRTEWWYRLFYPLSILSLILFGLLQGGRIDRRDAAGGVFKTIMVLIVYMVVLNLVLGLGNHNKLPPFVAACLTQVVFGAVALGVLAGKFGWWWQLLALARGWRVQRMIAATEEGSGETEEAQVEKAAATKDEKRDEKLSG
jgi:lipopolysaccharide export system permease protein